MLDKKCNKLTFSLFKIVRGESKQLSIVHLHRIFKKSNLNYAKHVSKTCNRWFGA